MKSILTLILLALLLPGCSLFQTTPATIPLPDNAQQLKHWHISGKFGVRLQNEAHSAYVEWTQHNTHFEVLLFGPLGQGKSRLRGSDNHVQLDTANGETWHDTSPEALLERLYGWQLPVSRAQYWVKGLAAPNSPAQLLRDTNGNITHLEQDGWTIDYTAYLPPVPGQAQLPQKLVMRYDGVRVTLLIRQWQALAPIQ